MGVRRYDPGAQRFLQLDQFQGALADLALATDPLTQNRYDLAASNPLSGVEWDGHRVLLDPGVSLSHNWGTIAYKQANGLGFGIPPAQNGEAFGNLVDLAGGIGHTFLDLLSTGLHFTALSRGDFRGYLQPNFADNLDASLNKHVDTNSTLYQVGGILPYLIPIGGQAGALGRLALRTGEGVLSRVLTRLALRGAEAADQAATLRAAVGQRASDVIANQSIRARGPVLSGAMDRQTGEIFFGQNTGIPDPLHPDLQQLLEDFPGPGAPGKGIPGAHAEINALNQGLFARPGSQISDFIFYNVRLRGAAIGEPIAPCPNCAWFLGG